jgi:hypothetical protein
MEEPGATDRDDFVLCEPDLAGGRSRRSATPRVCPAKNGDPRAVKSATAS